MKSKYKSPNDMTIEELCLESKKQRREDRRKGYLEAIKELRKFAENELEIYPAYDLVMQQLNRMEGRNEHT